MKAVIFYIGLVVAYCQADIDWSKIKFFDPPCGDSQSRIVGGNVAEPHSFPYQAALVIDTPEGVFFCGGSLISKKFVLTAAHCVDSAITVKVILGAHNITDGSEDRTTVTAIKVTVHEKWSAARLVNDIALVQLPVEDITLNDNIKLVGLPEKSDVGNSFRGKSSIVSGWGRFTDKSKNASDVLRYVESNVMSNWLCNLMFLGHVKSTNICTSGFTKKGTCNGDSGGPLVVDGKQVGIVSFGFPKCESRWPSVYTRVTEYLDWIEENTKSKSDQ